MSAQVPSHAIDEAALRREADRIHRIVFGSPVPDDLARQYVALHRAQPMLAPPALPLRRDVIGDASLDLEAIELALRLRNRDNLATRKLHALCYLAETRAAYFDRFVTRRDRPLAALLALIGLALRSAWKLARGRYLVAKHRVV